MKEKLDGYIKEALEELGITDVAFTMEHPADMTHGDWATNLAMMAAKKADKNPRVLAEEIVAKLQAKRVPDIAAIDVAGPGFINFKIAPTVFDKELSRVISKEEKGEKWGWNDTLKGKKVMVEYTDPNPFKEFHIGHLMSNAIGESISRLVEASGAEVKRACHQGDVGLHVAKAIWGMGAKDENSLEFTELKHFGKTVSEFAAMLGKWYADGSVAYESDPKMKEDIQKINVRLYGLVGKTYDGVPPGWDKLLLYYYEDGKKVSLQYFETIYKRLGTRFDLNFFESATGEFGKKVVQENVGKVFEKSDGAVVYKGDEAKGLHTRVFINKDGLPTYEAKELGLAKIKYDTFSYDVSIIITGNEVNDYFKVLLDAMQKVFPELAAKTEHYSHGMLRLPTGKMSSRTGDVITAESLIEE